MHLSPLITIAGFTVLEAIKSRIIWLLIAGLISLFSLTEFIGYVTITESLPFKSALLGASLRILAVMVMALFVTTSMLRELNDKGLELVLSLPVPRAVYYLGKLLGFVVVALGVAMIVGLGLVLYVPTAPLTIWSVSLACELIIVVAFGLLSLVSFNQMTSAMSAVLVFYLLARSVNAVRLMGTGPLVDPDSQAQAIIRQVIDILAYVLPSLDRYTLSEWLVYHGVDWMALAFIAGQTLIYTALLSLAGLFDLYRRNL